MATKQKHESSAPLAQDTRPMMSVGPAPASGSPASPQGFVKLAKGQRKALHKVPKAGRDHASGIALEVSQGTFKSDFGDAAPDPAAIAEAVGLAAQWEKEATVAGQWRVYASDQRTLAWDSAARKMQSLRDLFLAAAIQIPAIAHRYPQIAAYFNVRTDQGKRSARARKASKAQRAASSSSEKAKPASPA